MAPISNAERQARFRRQNAAWQQRAMATLIALRDETRREILELEGAELRNVDGSPFDSTPMVDQAKKRLAEIERAIEKA